MGAGTARPGRAVFAAFLAAVILKLFLFDFVVADGRSMLPAIEPGRVLLVNRLAYGLRLPGAASYLFRWALPRQGDVVVFLTPQGVQAVKRCAAVQEGRFTAWGDNGPESFDSRSYGPVAADRVLGKVVGIR